MLKGKINTNAEKTICIKTEIANATHTYLIGSKIPLDHERHL